MHEISFLAWGGGGGRGAAGYIHPNLPTPPPSVKVKWFTPDGLTSPCHSGSAVATKMNCMYKVKEKLSEKIPTSN